MGCVENLEQKKKRLGIQYRITMQENNKKILKFQEERKDSQELMKNCQDGETEPENLVTINLFMEWIFKKCTSGSKCCKKIECNLLITA